MGGRKRMRAWTYAMLLLLLFLCKLIHGKIASGSVDNISKASGTMLTMTMTMRMMLTIIMKNAQRIKTHNDENVVNILNIDDTNRDPVLFP